MAAEISFEYRCIDAMYFELDVIANADGSGLLLIDHQIGDEVEIEELSNADQICIKLQVEDWKRYLKDMEDRVFEQHPAKDEFGAGYVRDLNKDKGK